jgi:hypothetical protein
MGRFWLLPDEEQLFYTGSDWLLVLLSSLDDELKANALLLFWRAWHLRNDVIHAQGYGESINIAS